MRTDLLAGVLGIVIFLGAWAFAGPYLFSKNTEKEMLAELGEIPQDRIIVDYGIGRDGLVVYSYLDKPVPEKLESDELPELRRENSYTKLVEIVDAGGEDRDAIVKLNSIVYSQPAFAKDIDGSWKYLEYATTTEIAFRNRDSTYWGRVREMFVRTAYADTTSPFSGAGDGAIDFFETGNAGALSSCRDSTTGAGSDYTSTSMAILVYRSTTFGAGEGACQIRRVFMPFNTSVIPAGSDVTAATLNLYVLSTQRQDTTNDGLTIVSGAPASISSLVDSDYPNVSTTLFATLVAINSLTTSAYNSFSFNASGLSHIESAIAGSCGGSAGYTCLSLRENHDTTVVSFTNEMSNSVTVSASEHTGTSQDPYLSITYTLVAPSTAVTQGLGLQSGYELIINSGGLVIQ